MRAFYSLLNILNFGKIKEPYDWLTTNELIEKYGQPNPEGTYLKRIRLPYTMRISWEKNTIVSTMLCHYEIADKLLNVFEEILEWYGYKGVKELNLDVFGGCFAYRKKRGGSSWSDHAWGLAIDLDPDNNGLKTKWKDASFSRPEYRKAIEIFYKYGFVNQGKEKGFDAMHFRYNQ